MKKNRSLVCQNNHCYDIAREGYVNLLPVNSRKSKDPGDNAAMMASRRTFLESGHYKPLVDSLIEMLRNFPTVEQRTMLDLGCGEGYYTGCIKKEISSLAIVGLDISKAAVKQASKKYSDIDFCVASAYELPIQEKSIDLILRIFAPSYEPEIQRIIKDGGYFITVTPGARHLIQLREIIYRNVLSSPPKPPAHGFQRKQSKTVQYTLSLKDSKSINQLIDMTPFGWKIKEEQKSRLLQLDSFEIDCDFNIEIFAKLPRIDNESPYARRSSAR